MATYPIEGDFRLSEDGTHFLMTSGIPRLKQRIRRGLRQVLGANRYDRKRGLPWFDGMLDKGQRFTFEATIRSYLTSFPEVTQILAFEMLFTPKTRTISVNYRLLVDTGDVIEDSVPFDVIS